MKKLVNLFAVFVVSVSGGQAVTVDVRPLKAGVDIAYHEIKVGAPDQVFGVFNLTVTGAEGQSLTGLAFSFSSNGQLINLSPAISSELVGFKIIAPEGKVAGPVNAGIGGRSGCIFWFDCSLTTDQTVPYVILGQIKHAVLLNPVELHLRAFRLGTEEWRYITPASLGTETVTTNANPFISMLSPNGGETFLVGEQYAIRWGTQNLPVNSQVMIQLRGWAYPLPTRDLVTIDAQSGSYSWRVPGDLPQGEYRIEIYHVGTEGVANGLAKTISQDSFIIHMKTSSGDGRGGGGTVITEPGSTPASEPTPVQPALEEPTLPPPVVVEELPFVGQQQLFYILESEGGVRKAMWCIAYLDNPVPSGTNRILWDTSFYQSYVDLNSGLFINSDHTVVGFRLTSNFLTAEPQSLLGLGARIRFFRVFQLRR